MAIAHEKAKAFAKWSVWVEKLKWPKKTGAKRLYKKTRVVLFKKPLEKKSNIREMRRFWKSTILERLQPMQRL